MKKSFVSYLSIGIIIALAGRVGSIYAKVSTGPKRHPHHAPVAIVKPQPALSLQDDAFLPNEDIEVSRAVLTDSGVKAVDSAIEMAIVSASMTVDQEIALAKKTPGVEFSIFSANVHLFPFIIHKVGSSYNDASKMRVEGFRPNNPNTLSPARARSMGKALVEKKGENPYDVIVLQEAWDKQSRQIFFEEIQNIYPYRMEDDYQSYLAYAGFDVIMGSGLAIYSRYPFEQVIGRDGKKDNHILETFVDYRGDECFAHKGFLLVKIRKNGVPVYVLATHLQAGASDGDRKYMAGASRASTREVAKKEMEQIRMGLAIAIMHDCYASDLDAIIKRCKIDNSGIGGLLNAYVWNFGKKITEKVKRNITGAQVATTDEQIEMACLTEAVGKFIKDHPDFWQKVYVFLAGDFNIAAVDDDYQDIVTVFGANAQTIMKADEKGSTSYDNLATGTVKYNQRIDHILSIGRTPVQKSASSINANYLANIVGGSYISSVFDHTHTDHVALEALFKLQPVDADMRKTSK